MRRRWAPGAKLPAELHADPPAVGLNPVVAGAGREVDVPHRAAFDGPQTETTLQGLCVDHRLLEP